MTNAIPLFLAMLLLSASTAFSDDSPSAQPVQSPKQKMQICITKQRQTNPDMSYVDLKKQCAQLIQAQDSHPSVPPGQTPTHQ